MYLIHANLFIRTAFGACKSFIHPRTMVKIRVAGTDPQEIQDMLSAEGVNRDCLPKWIGGNLEGEGVATEPPQGED